MKGKLARRTPSNTDAGGSAASARKPQRSPWTQLRSDASAPSTTLDYFSPGPRALPDSIRAPFERSVGHSVADVRVHTESAVPPSMSARAVAHGRDLYFGPGEFRPDSRRGRRLIAHEVAHTLQQRDSGTSAPPGPAHEANASRVASSLLAGRPLAPSQVRPSAVGPARQDAGSDPDVEDDDYAMTFTVTDPHGGDKHPEIDYEHARARNLFWDARLRATAIAPFAPTDPEQDPVRYANLVYRFQYWVQYSGLDLELVGERLVRDGMLGPRTLRLIAAVATHPDLAAMVKSADRWKFTGTFVERWQSKPPEVWEAMALSAAIELDEPEILERWDSGPLPFQTVVRYWRAHGLTKAMRAEIDAYFEVDPKLTPTNAQRFEALELLFASTQWTALYSVVLTPRKSLELLESERLVLWQLDEQPEEGSGYYLYFGASTKALLEDVETHLSPRLPESDEARTAIRQIQGHIPVTGDLPALTVGFRIPKVKSTDRRLAGYSAFQLASDETSVELALLIAEGERLGDEAEAAREAADQEPKKADILEPKVLLKLLSNGQGGEGDTTQLLQRIGMIEPSDVCVATRPYLIVNLEGERDVVEVPGEVEEALALTDRAGGMLPLNMGAVGSLGTALLREQVEKQYTRKEKTYSGAFTLWIDDIAAFQDQSTKFQANPLEFGSFRGDSERFPIDNRYFDAKETDAGIEVVRNAPPSKMSDKSLESIKASEPPLHPLQPVRVDVSRYFPGMHPLLPSLILLAGGEHVFRADEPRWVFASQLPDIAKGLYAEKQSQTYGEAFDVFMTVVGIASVGAAPAIYGAQGATMAGRAWPAVREFAGFAAGEMLGQYLNSEMDRINHSGTDEEKAQMQSRMKGVGLAMLAVLAFGGTSAIKGSAFARMGKAVNAVDGAAGGLTKGMGGYLDTLSARVLGKKTDVMAKVAMREASPEMVAEFLPKSVLKGLDVVVDPDLMPGTIRVVGKDAAEGGGAILKVADTIRPRDLELHIPRIKAEKGYVGAWKIWGRVKELLTKPIPGMMKKADPADAAAHQKLVDSGLASSKEALEEAVAEVGKLGKLLEERRAWLASGELSEGQARVAAVEAELMQAQLHYFEAVLDGRAVMQARGYVAWDPLTDTAAMAERLAGRSFDASKDLIVPYRPADLLAGFGEDATAATIRAALAADEKLAKFAGSIKINAVDEAGTVTSKTVLEWLDGLDGSLKKTQILDELASQHAPLHDMVYFGHELTFRRGTHGTGGVDSATNDDVTAAAEMLVNHFEATQVSSTTLKGQQHYTLDVPGWGRWRLMLDDRSLEFRLPPMNAEMEQRFATTLLPDIYKRLSQQKKALYPDQGAGGGHIHMDAEFALQNPELVGKVLSWYMHMEPSLYKAYVSGARGTNRANKAARKLLGNAHDYDSVDSTVRSLGAGIDGQGDAAMDALNGQMSKEFYESLTGIKFDDLGADPAREWGLNLTTLDSYWEHLHLNTIEFRLFDAPRTAEIAGQQREVLREFLRLAFQRTDPAPSGVYREAASHEDILSYLRGL